jgi:tRNA threonylcarbamoyladenosine biosynthesis protein TsaB
LIALALDTATSATVLGLLLADGTVHEARDDVDAGQRPRHTARLLPLAATLLDDAGLSWSDLELIAVGLGPGTFTGLRIGIATARGLAAATGAALVGLGTLPVLAAGAGPGRVLAVIDARRGEVFAAGYEDGREVIAPAALAPTALADLAAGSDWLAVGDGALRFREVLEGGGLIVAPERSPLHLVSSAAILRRAVEDEVEARGAVLPIYLRLPDAELALRAAAT